MKSKFLKIFFSLILFYLLAAFVGSVIILQTEDEDNNIYTGDVVDHASKYLSNEYLIKKGEGLDCSGYTWAVYKHFDFNLPQSANEQYSLFNLDTETTKPGDLVFFSIENKEVNHVGILINDSIFLHSPGKNKAVRTDNTNSTYWLKYFKGIGRVIKRD